MEMQRIGPRIDTWLRRTGPVDLVENLFLRMLGVVYLLAFASLWPQIIGLIGSGGIVPVSQLLIAMHGELGPRAYYDVPSLFWFNAADSMLWLACAAGCLASLFLIVNMFSRLAAIACFILYLSLSSAGQPFTSFQWDALLLEAGFLAIFAGAPVLVWAYRLLLFRLTFESGWVKLASHDPNWRNLHALRFHFLTQPLPNPFAYYAYRAPAALLDSLTAATLLIEFIASIFLFGPRRARRVGAALLAALQVTIILTGNYAFFNLLTLALCLWALDDQALRRLAPILKWRFPRTSISSRVPMLRLSATGAVLILLCLGLLQFLNSLLPPPSRLSAPLAAIQPLEIVNSY